MNRSEDGIAAIRARLMTSKAELQKRVSTIHEHARNPLEQDSAEQAAQIGNVAVVSVLEAEAVSQIGEIDAALMGLEHGTYGICASCGDPIDERRLSARPAATQCRDCAELDARSTSP